MFVEKKLNFKAYKVSKLLGSVKHNSNVKEILNREEDGNKQYDLFT